MPSRKSPPASASANSVAHSSVGTRRSSLLSESTHRSSSSRSRRSDAAVEALTETFRRAGLSSQQALMLSASFAQYACDTAAANASSSPTPSSPSISSLSSLSSYDPVTSPVFVRPAQAESSCPRPRRSQSSPLHRLPSVSSAAVPLPRSRDTPPPPARSDTPPVPFTRPWKVPRDFDYHVPPPAERTSSDYYVVTKGYELGVFSSWSQTAPLVLGVSSAQHHWVETIEQGVEHIERELALGTVYLVPRPAEH